MHQVSNHRFSCLSHAVNRSSVERVLDLLTTESIVDPGSVRRTTKNFLTVVLMYQACRALSIHYSYTLPLHNRPQKEITDRMLTFEGMESLICRIVVTGSLFRQFAGIMCHRRLKK